MRPFLFEYFIEIQEEKIERSKSIPYVRPTRSTNHMLGLPEAIVAFILFLVLLVFTGMQPHSLWMLVAQSQLHACLQMHPLQKKLWQLLHSPS